MEEVLPEDYFKFVVQHHDTHRVSTQYEHLVVNFGVLHYVPAHSLRGLIVHVSANLAIKLAHFRLNLLQFSRVQQVKQVGTEKLCVILYQVQNFFPVLPPVSVENSVRNHTYTGNPHKVIKDVVKKRRDLC